MKAIKLIDTGKILLGITYPELILHRKNNNGDMDCGPYLTNLNTGICFSKWDYGIQFKIQILGLGLDFSMLHL